MKMKTVLMGMVALIGMASCSNDDNQIAQGTTGELEGTDMELTFSVNESQDESVFTRAMADEPQTERQTFMGMEVETTVTEDKTGAPSAAEARTRATVYNTVDLEGKTVYAFVYDPSTNKTVAARQTLTVTGGKLTVRGKRGCQILFYIGNAPYASKGVDLSAITVSQSSSTDPMQCVSDVITSANQDLGTLSFKHVFTKIRVVLKTSDGRTVNAFKVTSKDALSSQSASVNIFDRSYIVSGSKSTVSLEVKNNTTSTATADYKNIIVDPSQPEKELSMLFAEDGQGATIGGSRNMLTKVNNLLTLKTRKLLPGHRYSINLTVKPATEEYMNSGFRADKNFYQWDAYEPYGVGDPHTWSAGNSGIHKVPAGGQNQDIATQSCKDCPSADEAKMYLGAGVLIDDGHTGAYQQAYITTDPATGEKRTYHGGVWLKKKQYIPGFAAGTAPKATSAAVTNGRPTAENINEYFFLPFYGFYDNTSGLTNLYHSYGAAGYFMSKTANETGYAYYLTINSTSARFGRALNWTSNDLCSTTIWSAD
ncbi:fimbrillin family protein [Prevotella sp. KH2C16]|uniref:fimbrillin family protein n=1 Tax=Prevotella sp. KH2C16 TaxID=1855325 RepID=UPI00116038D0|nr:fimbrillin family protein [Prevotella sp. KH2C16]